MKKITILFTQLIFIILFATACNESTTNNGTETENTETNNTDNSFCEELKTKCTEENPTSFLVEKQDNWVKVEDDFGKKYLASQEEFKPYFEEGSFTEEAVTEVYYYAYMDAPKDVACRAIFLTYFSFEGPEQKMILVDFDESGNILKTHMLAQAGNGGVWSRDVTVRFLENGDYETTAIESYPPAMEDKTVSLFKKKEDGSFAISILDTKYAPTYSGDWRDLQVDDLYIAMDDQGPTKTIEGILMYAEFDGIQANTGAYILTNLEGRAAKYVLANDPAITGLLSDPKNQGRKVLMQCKVEQEESVPVAYQNQGKLSSILTTTVFNLIPQKEWNPQTVKVEFIEQLTGESAVFLEKNGSQEEITGMLDIGLNGKEITVCYGNYARLVVTNLEFLD